MPQVSCFVVSACRHSTISRSSCHVSGQSAVEHCWPIVFVRARFTSMRLRAERLGLAVFWGLHRDPPERTLLTP